MSSTASRATAPTGRVRPALVGAERALPSGGVLDLFEGQVRARPEATALVCRGDRRSYAELDAEAVALAHRLAAAGVRRRAVVAVAVGRSFASVAALLAVWKLDAVCLPLDPAHPADRLAFQLADAGAAAVVADVGTADRFLDAAVPVVLAGVRPAGVPGPLPVREPVAADSPAYLLYTSGSTGLPKGVRGGHRALLNVVLELADTLRTGPDSRWASMAQTTFDISLGEICVPLASGARLVVPTEAELKDAAALVRLLAAEGVDRMQAVPSQWQALLDAGYQGPDTLAMTGGEALTPALARRLRPRVRGLVNGYGPTETTVLSTLWRVPSDVDGSASTAIGTPIANTRAYLLDDRREPVPAGEPGELYLAGDGVAVGYLHRPDLDSERFLPEPDGDPGGRCYRTGDRCRLRPDGTLEYLGREDGQVKVRGQRVELGEVESRLAEHAGLGAVAAAVRDDTLIAFVVPAPGAVVTAEGIRAHLAARVPGPLVPSLVVFLDALPLTAHGKVDRAALTAAAEPAVEPAVEELPADPASDPLTAEVCAICREVLGVASVRAEDDLFDLGAHSLTVMQLAARMGASLGVEIPTGVIYDAERVADLVDAVRALLPLPSDGS